MKPIVALCLFVVLATFVATILAVEEAVDEMDMEVAEARHGGGFGRGGHGGYGRRGGFGGHGGYGGRRGGYGGYGGYGK